MRQDFCFCTLATGKRYRKHAKFLAEDIQKHAPGIIFLILTDQPSDFSNYSHVLTHKYRLKSVKGLYDKPFVVERALENFDSCIFIDSDVRIVSPVSEKMEFQPGITARTGCDLLKHVAKVKRGKTLSLTKRVAQEMEIDLEGARWFHEFMFTVSKHGGAEAQFFREYRKIANAFESSGIYHGVGNVIGLAAAKADFPIRLEPHDRIHFFKDIIESERVKSGSSLLRDREKYFQLQREIEYPSRTLGKKVVDKLASKFTRYYRLIRLQLLSPLLS
jgi:hypothetical protein